MNLGLGILSEYKSAQCECGESMVLVGAEDDWRSRRAVFKCECARKLTLDDRADQEALAIT